MEKIEMTEGFGTGRNKEKGIEGKVKKEKWNEKRTVNALESGNREKQRK